MASESDAVTAMRLLVGQRIGETRISMACNYGTTAQDAISVARTAEDYAASLLGHARDLRAASTALDLLTASHPTGRPNE